MPSKRPSSGFCAPNFGDMEGMGELEDLEKYRRGGLHPVYLGDIIGNRYRIVHKLGYGGFSTVWLARDQRKQRNVALKICMADSPTPELATLKYLRDHGGDNPHIMSLRDAFEIQGPNGQHTCLVFDAAGPSLRDFTVYGDPIPISVRREAAGQISRGLAYLHSLGVCHGDLTDANIVFELDNIDQWSEAQIYQYLGKPITAPLKRYNGAEIGVSAPTRVVQPINFRTLDKRLLRDSVCIIDFGESFFTSDPTFVKVGTPLSYLAPEIAFGQTASTASDVWSLGCLIFELLSSRSLIMAPFGLVFEAIGMMTQTFGPFPKAWQERYMDPDGLLKPGLSGQMDHFYDGSIPLDRALQSQIRKIKPPLSPHEVGILLNLLEGMFAYEPKDRVSAKEVISHAWFKIQS